MATVKKKQIGRQTYYYLEHTFRHNGKIRKKERYLGKKVPENIDELKTDFFVEIYKEKWYPLFDRIKELYATERRLMPKTAKEKEIQDFAIRFTYDTNRIEGSKLTLRDTAELLEKGLTPKAKPLDDVKEAEAHEKVFYDVLTSKKDLALQIVLYWHKKLFESTKSDIAGIIRQHQVAIAGSKFMPPFTAEIYPLLSELFNWYNKNKDKIHPVELAALVHIKFVTIHPFTDGNGRLSRLMMNFVLHKYEFPLLDIHYVDRTGYYNALERAQIKKEDNIFVQWLFRRYVKEYGRYS